MLDPAPLLSLLNLVGLGGVAWFIYAVYKGLRDRINALTQLAEEQQKTLDVVRTRAVELEQLRKDYRQAVDDFQDLGHKLDERRNAVIRELERANNEKDSELARLKRLELEEIELKTRSLEKLPQLEQTLKTTILELQRQVRLVAGRDLLNGTVFTARHHYMPKSLLLWSDPEREDNAHAALSLYLSSVLDAWSAAGSDRHGTHVSPAKPARRAEQKSAEEEPSSSSGEDTPSEDRASPETAGTENDAG